MVHPSIIRWENEEEDSDARQSRISQAKVTETDGTTRGRRIVSTRNCQRNCVEQGGSQWTRNKQTGIRAPEFAVHVIQVNKVKSRTDCEINQRQLEKKMYFLRKNSSSGSWKNWKDKRKRRSPGISILGEIAAAFNGDDNECWPKGLIVTVASTVRI